MGSDERKLFELVERSLAEKNLRQAIMACRELNVRFPEYFDGWRIAGDVHMSSGKPEAVLFATSKAESIRPGDPAIALQRIEAYIGLEDISSARKLLLEFDSDIDSSVAIHDRMGRHMASLDLHAEALSQYQKALKHEADNPALLFNLATAQRFLGRTDGAVETLDRVLEINSGDFEAQAMRSSLKKQSATSNHIAELEDLLATTEMTDAGKTSICYALAKEYDDIDDPAKSFGRLQLGADLRRSHMDYRVETDLEVLSELQRVYSKEFFTQGEPGDPGDEPIFIVGLPRTGTTLVERILSSHSSVYSAGELDNFGREVMRQVRKTDVDEQTNRIEVIEQCSKLDFTRLGRAYIDSTRPMTGEKPRFIDKLPFNYLYVGLIHRALPNARIVNLVRHPMATCYSIYKQLFRDPYPFSYDLDDLARYYLAYRELMDHWQRVLPGVIHSVSYEDVVADTESESRRLLEFCGLDWEDQCLRFYENKQASTTASAAQVRKPVYRSSLDRWTTYRDHLKPVEQILIEAGVDTSAREALP